MCMYPKRDIDSAHSRRWPCKAHSHVKTFAVEFEFVSDCNTHPRQELDVAYTAAVVGLKEANHRSKAFIPSEGELRSIYKEALSSYNLGCPKHCQVGCLFGVPDRVMIPRDAFASVALTCTMQGMVPTKCAAVASTYVVDGKRDVTAVLMEAEMHYRMTEEEVVRHTFMSLAPMLVRTSFRHPSHSKRNVIRSDYYEFNCQMEELTFFGDIGCMATLDTADASKLSTLMPSSVWCAQALFNYAK